MGHYLSEMESSDEAARRNTWESNLHALHELGYWHPGVKTPRLGLGGGTVAMHHVPCGLAVYDPRVHDKFCPAKSEGS